MKVVQLLARVAPCAGVLALLSVWTAGCAHETGLKPMAGVAAETRDFWRQPPARDTVIGPGDVLEFKFFYLPELNETQTVRPDGRVMLQLVGETVAAGVTPAALREELQQRYGAIFKTPELAVAVRSRAGDRVFVGGEVNSPGPVVIQGRLNVLDAIVYAGSYKSVSANLEAVVVLRDWDGRRHGVLLDLRKAVEQGDASDLIPVCAGDIVIVPRTTIVKVDTWVEQHINRLIPELGVSYSHSVGSGTGAVDWTQVGRSGGQP